MNNAIKKLFIVVLAVNALLSIFNVFYNTAKIPSEIKSWAYLSDNQKRAKIFGDLYNFLIFIDSKTEKNATVFIYSDDPATYYLGIYYLYPRKIAASNNIVKIKPGSLLDTYSYIAVYNKHIIHKEFNVIASYSSKESKNFGIIYKRK